MSLLHVAMVTALSSLSTPPDRGISEALARERRAIITDLAYQLAFEIPADRQQPVTGRVNIRFRLAAAHRIVLDFGEPRERIRSVRLDGRDITPDFVEDHLVIQEAATRAGINEFAIEFIAGDDALNRNDEFLYTLFVPARAHLTFPCFDQPDLKARFRLTLTLPAGWQAVSNGAELSTARARAAIVAFAETAPLPTYLLAFAAGRFSIETATRAGRELRMFHRETDEAKVARNRDAIFDLHGAALEWLEAYTGLSYPFAKLDFVLIPSFQFGGMEHAGAVLYNASGLMLDESATQNQRLARASVIAHETAHMWFGDLVTMRWFDDVWMKEVFANFMAAKIVNPSFPEVNHDLRFLLAHYPSAYQVDRTLGTNAVRQPLANLAEAGQLYGPIIYQKAPIVMRQLELLVGETPLRDGLREYLKTYAFGNASWLDLVRILDSRTPADLAAWSRAWIEERGRPRYTTVIDVNETGRVSALKIVAEDPFSRSLVWPQRLRITIGYRDAGRDVQMDVAGGTAAVPGVDGHEPPLYVLPNGGGIGYGMFVLDGASRRYLLSHVEDLGDALTRGSAWVTLWDNMLDGRLGADEFVASAMRALPRETDEQNVQRVLAYLVHAFWKFLPPGVRQARQAALESLLRTGLAAGRTESEKAAWFHAYRDTVLSREGLEWLERVWRRETSIPGLSFAETDEIDMALELAVREVPGWAEILTTQLARTANPDRKARFAFVMPALSAHEKIREQAFERYRDPVNRRREPWVLDSLQYLNHPLRQSHARKFIGSALSMLREIQRTGDIFFPTRWMASTLWGHQSEEAARIVRDFLANERDYPERLRWTILSTSDELLRAAAMTSVHTR